MKRPFYKICLCIQSLMLQSSIVVQKHINTVELCFFMKMNLVILSLSHKHCPAAAHAHRQLERVPNIYTIYSDLS